MKPHLTLLLLLSLCFSSLHAQKKKKQTVPNYTPSNERWEGYQQRKSLIDASLVKNVPFRNVGPTIMSGRVVDFAIDPKDPTHFFVAYASGGLWETTNEGTSFEPLFDQEIVMTIGDIAVDWDQDIIYVGTGENNSSRSSYAGYGLFKSADHGKTWEHLGLPESHHIGRVILHPNEPATMWVAVLGHLYSKNSERGIYKTTDGGKSWRKTLYVDDQTGIVELVQNPSNPDELLAAAWQKDRKAWNFVESGQGSGLYKSVDGGESWKNISEGDNGFPDSDGMGRVGLAYAPTNSDIIYAVLDNQDRREEEEKKSYAVTKELLRTISVNAFMDLSDDDINDFLDRENFPDQYNAVDIKEDVQAETYPPKDLVTYLEDANSMLIDTPVKGAEVYKSSDGGLNWTKTHEGYIESLVYSYGYYFGQIYVDGLNPDIVYTMGVPLIKSMDGGKTWEATESENVHSDHHALWTNPARSGHLINGNDGGVNISYDYGETWIKCNSPAVGQFYSVNVDMAEPYNVYGGLQDNGVWMGPSTYEYSRNWHDTGDYPYKRLAGGDGMQVVIDTRTNDLVYTGSQFGNYYRINTATSDRKYITPSHKLGEQPFRWNWQAPILLSSHNQDIVYFGSNKFHRSMDQGETFEALSGDLTTGGKKGDVSYGTLTTISESPLQFGLLYVGSDDGLIHHSKDAGVTWKNISGTLPQQYWISRVEASNHQKGRVYASLNGYRWDDFQSLVYVSEDFGATWNRIGMNLPAEPVNVIKEDPDNEKILYVGTDHGVYVSIDQGITFMAFQKGLPAVPVHDLVIHPREKDLVLGTHGRSIYIADLSKVQQLPELSGTLKIFDLDKIRFSDRWGNRGRGYWSGYYEPSSEIELFSPDNGNAMVSIAYEDLYLASWSVELDAGLNYLPYDYSLDSVQAVQLGERLELKEEEMEAKENGKYYLQPGTYTITVTQGSTSNEEKLVVEEPRERSKRKGSEKLAPN